MTLRVWRTTRAAYAAYAFTGEGARLYGGRWGEVGVPLVYTSAHLSLSVLEVLVQLADYADLADYVAVTATFDERLVETVAPEDLPTNWRSLPPPRATRAWGSQWARERRSAVLRVPSVVVPEEANYVLNPLHPDFAAIEIGEARPLEIDPRLVKRLSG